MDDGNKVEIPLVLQMFDPVAVFVVNNENRGFELYVDVEQHPLKPYTVLFDLYINLGNHETLPELLYNHFKEYPQRGKTIYDEVHLECFAGDHHNLARYDCINFATKIITKPRPAVLLHNFKYGRFSMGTIIDLDITVNLTIQEAFIIFSNMCVNTLWYWWWDGLRKSLPRNFENREKLENYLKESKAILPEDICFQFYAFDYLKYLSDQLLSDKLLPLELLRLNGAPLLAIFYFLPQVKNFLSIIFAELDNFDEVSERKKILYLQFLLHIYDKWLNENIDKNAIVKIEQLKKAVLKDFHLVEFNDSNIDWRYRI